MKFVVLEEDDPQAHRRYLRVLEKLKERNDVNSVQHACMHAVVYVKKRKRNAEINS